VLQLLLDQSLAQRVFGLPNIEQATISGSKLG
jgi:hypothetical protein